MELLLAIETSCDETAVALIDCAQGTAPLRDRIRSEFLASSAKLHEIYGGVVPELAAREQLSLLSPLVQEALQSIGASPQDIRAVAATAGPGLNGSLLVGFSLARGLAYGLNVPLIPINHLEGHLAAHDLLSAPLAEPYLSLLVSGGHSELIHCEGKRALLCRTRDDAAGEAFDKCATLLDLPYPGGPALSELALSGRRDRFVFPIGVPHDPTSFSFSGLKTAVLRQIQELPSPLSTTDRADLAASAEEAIVQALIQKTMHWANEKSVNGVFVTGGVAANSHLRSELKRVCDARGLQFRAAELRYTTDNATMIGAAAFRILQEERYQRWKRSPGEELGPGTPFEISTRTSWPIAEK